MMRQRKDGKIFINYRRSDARGVAGRLSDSLENYFGEERIFRDIEGIKGGANFEEVLDQSVNSADAVIVLMGPDWLDAKNESGQRRLEDPEDWVAREIAGALKRDIPVFPVLVEDAFMPRPDDLPGDLRPLCRLNAISISDHRWEHDIDRLAKVVAMDLPGSLAEKRLDLVNMVVSLCLFLAIVFPAVVIAKQSLAGQTLAIESLEKNPAALEVLRIENKAGDESEGSSETLKRLREKVWEYDGSVEVTLPVKDLIPYSFWRRGIPFVFILLSAALLLPHLALVAPEKRHLVRWSSIVGMIGTGIAFVAVLPLAPYREALVCFSCSTITASAMFVLLSLSGFKPR